MTEVKSKTTLEVPRGEAFAKISGHTSTGKKLLEKAITNTDQLKEAKNKFNKWHDYAKTLLIDSFSDESIASEIEFSGVVTPPYSLKDKISTYRDDFNREITALESIEDRLPIFRENSKDTSAPIQKSSTNRFSVETRTWQVLLTVIVFMLALLGAFLDHIFGWT